MHRITKIKSSYISHIEDGKVNPILFAKRGEDGKPKQVIPDLKPYDHRNPKPYVLEHDSSDEEEQENDDEEEQEDGDEEQEEVDEEQEGADDEQEDVDEVRPSPHPAHHASSLLRLSHETRKGDADCRYHGIGTTRQENKDQQSRQQQERNQRSHHRQWKSCPHEVWGVRGLLR